ncbi:zinc finger HIT domain-containing protein 1 isoform X2 [Amphiprion ocellaris]|uniref:zinc finger HIT domain-containing protein 1 isoform X2 n=1 Tax=Amphiprion ocellaris TaxID=80972 RepID=UPI000C30D3E4|nr:zinc finger HIT domain-containing protein 1 isoform X2 [Amphiprion ocellaris]
MKPSSPPRPPRLSLQSPELQSEFFKEFRNKLRPQRDVCDSGAVSPPSSPPSSPFSPAPSPSSSSSSSPSSTISPARLLLSSPELLSELRESRTRPLRHVPAHKGLTTVFSGRGRGRAQNSNSSPNTKPANQKTSR